MLSLCVCWKVIWAWISRVIQTGHQWSTSSRILIFYQINHSIIHTFYTLSWLSQPSTVHIKHQILNLLILWQLNSEKGVRLQILYYAILILPSKLQLKRYKCSDCVGRTDDHWWVWETVRWGEVCRLCWSSVDNVELLPCLSYNYCQPRIMHIWSDYNNKMSD